MAFVSSHNHRQCSADVRKRNFVNKNKRTDFRKLLDIKFRSVYLVRMYHMNILLND